MANRTDVSDLLSSCRWSDEGSYLGEIAKSGFPIVAKVSRGQYQNIGQPSFSNPSLVSHVLLVSAGKKLQLAAQCVKFKNSRQRVVPFGPTLSIPQDFEGHFEILSEDGRAVPCIQTVSALTRKFPDACLVRETLKAYKPDAKSAVVIPPKLANHPTKHGGGEPPDSIPNLHGLIQPSYKISDKTRLIQPGEILVLVGEVSVPTGKKVSRYLRCFDSKGQTVYLNSAQKGKFSPLARQDSISGVHTTKNILSKRLPLMVRLVDGKPPVMPTAKTSSFKFVPELRLFSTIQEELIFAMPLSQNWKESQSMVPLPLSVPLKFQTCRNMGDVEHTKEFSRIHEKAKTLVDHSKNLIQIYDINLKKELRFDGRQWKAYAPPLFLTPSSPDPIIPINGNGNNQQNGNSSSPGENNCSKPEKNSTATVISNTSAYDEIPDAQDYEDIDEIYDYVRGIKPPPPKLLAGQNNVDSTSNVVSTNNERNKEIPLKLDCNKASQYNKNKNGSGHNKSPHVSKNNGRAIAHHHQQHHHHNSPNHDKLSGVPTSPTTIVTITTPLGRNEPDLIVGSVPPPPVPKHRVPYGRLLSSKSLERLDASDSDYDEPPPPPPIETIPSKQNLFFLNPPGGVSVSVSNKNSKNLPKLEPENLTIGENEAEITNEIHNNGNSVQIQIRSTENPQKLKCSSSGNGTQYGYTSSQTGFTSITPSSTGRDNNNGLHSTHNNISSHHGHHHSHHNPYSHPYSLGSTGNSINTSGSGGSYGSSSSGGDKKGKPKQHLYVKHNSTNGSNNHCSSPLSGGGGGLLAADLNGKGLSGSPANRIVFRRSPIFDCRYKSMNDLNRCSLESGVSSSGGAGVAALGGSGGGGVVGASSQRHRCYPHNSGSHHAFNANNSSNMSRDSPLANSGLNLNLNLLNLNMNLKASGKSKGIFRPKSLTNLVFNDDAYAHHYGGSNGSGGGLIGGVKKKLTDMVVPNHHHAAHTPPPPPVEILQKVPLKCSQRTRKSSTPTQHTPTLYL